MLSYALPKLFINSRNVIYMQIRFSYYFPQKIISAKWLCSAKTMQNYSMKSRFPSLKYFHIWIGRSSPRRIWNKNWPSIIVMSKNTNKNQQQKKRCFTGVHEGSLKNSWLENSILEIKISAWYHWIKKMLSHQNMIFCFENHKTRRILHWREVW